MSIKIQINSLEALERLIGGDSELEISIRNSVVQNFAKHHIKAIALDKTVQDAVEQMREEVEHVIAKKVDGRFKLEGYAHKSYKLKTAQRAVIEREVKTAISRIITEEVEKAVAVYDVTESVESFIEYGITKKVRQALQTLLANVPNLIKET